MIWTYLGHLDSPCLRKIFWKIKSWKLFFKICCHDLAIDNFCINYTIWFNIFWLFWIVFSSFLISLFGATLGNKLLFCHSFALFFIFFFLFSNCKRWSKYFQQLKRIRFFCAVILSFKILERNVCRMTINKPSKYPFIWYSQHMVIDSVQSNDLWNFELIKNYYSLRNLFFQQSYYWKL